MMTEDMTENLQQQVEALYAERELLSEELGCNDAEDVINMVRNLELQLADFYRQYGGRTQMSDAATDQLMQHIHELSKALDGLYSQKSITVEMREGQPTIRATWTEHNHTAHANQGAK